MKALLKNKWKEDWVMACWILIAAGLVFSRALLSFASVLMIVPLFFSLKERKPEERILIATGFLLLPVLVSGLWSQDMPEWWNTVFIRLPLLTMTGCFATTLSRQKWLWAAWVYLTCIAAGCIWSLFQYVIDVAAIQESYLRAKVLPTLADNDHVRFSWMVAIAVLMSIQCFRLYQSKRLRYTLLGLSVFFIAFLHILAAKTGLLCLYASGAIYFLYLMFIQKKWKTGMIVVITAIAIAAIAYQTLPTLRNRVQYIRYDFSFYATGNYTPGLNDASRWTSIQAGYGIMQSRPLNGVGFGDIRGAVNEWHNKYRPQSLPYERFLPANEWMVYGAGSGWPGLICFTAGLLLLLYRTTSRNIFSVIFSVMAFIPFATDDTLEGQLGVAILAFIAFFAQRYPLPAQNLIHDKQFT